jgi:hypothetical protein
MAKSSYHLQQQPIPDGLQIFADRLEVAGLAFRKNDATAFASSSDGWLELERELTNKFDRNAIKLIGCSDGFFGTKRRFIGYVPKDVASIIVEGGFLDTVQPRLLKTYVGEGGFVEILFQILGPKGQRYQFDPPPPPDGSHYTAYVDRVKQLKSGHRFEEAIELLLKLVEATEKEAKAHGNGWGVAPWYYEQLAIIYRKEKRYDAEVQILERYESQSKAVGAGPSRLAERLVKAKQLSDKRHA